ncbi:hypothetical protein [Methanobrevibacter sp.]
MKLYKILGIAMILLMLAVGVVSAMDISDFKPPEGFDDGFGAAMEKDDFAISLEDYDKDLHGGALDGDHFHNYNVKGKVAEYNDTFNNEYGVVELVEVGKETYLVKCVYKGDAKDKTSECTKYLEEFNKVNNLKQLKIKAAEDI